MWKSLALLLIKLIQMKITIICYFNHLFNPKVFIQSSQILRIGTILEAGDIAINKIHKNPSV